MEEDIVIVGAGISGLTTSLGLHRLGLRSIVLESSDSLRTTGFVLALWTNAWTALDVVGIGDSLRKHSLQICGLRIASLDSGLPNSEISLEADGKFGDFEGRCVKRKEVLETLLDALPPGTVRYSSKVVSIEELGHFKLLYLADGSTLKTKGRAKWLGLQNPVYTGRSAIRGLAEFPNAMALNPSITCILEAAFAMLFFHVIRRARIGFAPSFLRLSNVSDQIMEENPVKIKQFVLDKISNIAREARNVVERTELHCISCASLTVRLPWNILFGNIFKDNVCAVGDALHPMTPEIGQGGYSALEDSVVLARCLAEAFLRKKRGENVKEKEDFERIKRGMEKYGQERRWRSFRCDGKVMSFLREKWLSNYTSETLVKMANFDCGDLVDS